MTAATDNGHAPKPAQFIENKPLAETTAGLPHPPPPRVQESPPPPDPLTAAKSLALATLCAIMNDAEAPPNERRLAATVILRYAESAERTASKPLPQGGVGCGHSKPHPEGDDRGVRPAPGFVSPTESLKLQRHAYDCGYWRGFRQESPRPDAPRPGSACPAPGRSDIPPNSSGRPPPS